MGFLRNTIALAFVATLLFYFVSVGEMDENQQWITIGVMITLGLVYILSGSPSFELPTPPTAATKVTAKEAVEVAQSDADEVQEEAATTPSPATCSFDLATNNWPSTSRNSPFFTHRTLRPRVRATD